MLKLFLLISLFFSLISSQTTISLSSSPKIDLIYTFPSPDTISLTLQFSTQGYISIGFGTTMSSSQIYLAYKSTTNDFIVESTHASGHMVPTPDPVQNLQVVSATRDSQKTVVTFTRKLDTGNSQDVKLSVGVPIDLIWAYGLDDNLVHHVGHGHQSVIFSAAKGLNRFQKMVMNLGDDHF